MFSNGGRVGNTETKSIQLESRPRQSEWSESGCLYIMPCTLGIHYSSSWSCATCCYYCITHAYAITHTQRNEGTCLHLLLHSTYTYVRALLLPCSHPSSTTSSRNPIIPRHEDVRRTAGWLHCWGVVLHAASPRRINRLLSMNFQQKSQRNLNLWIYY